MTFRKDRLLSAVVAAISILLFLPTHNFPKSASYYPQGILILIGLLCIPLWVKAKKDETVTIELVLKNFLTARNLLYVIVSIILLISLMDVIGLYIELPLFVGFIMYRLGFRKRLPLFAISLGLTFLVYLLFGVMLKVQIPMGLLQM